MENASGKREEPGAAAAKTFYTTLMRLKKPSSGIDLPKIHGTATIEKETLTERIQAGIEQKSLSIRRRGNLVTIVHEEPAENKGIRLDQFSYAHALLSIFAENAQNTHVGTRYNRIFTQHIGPVGGKDIRRTIFEFTFEKV
ncbi:MAG: hypothetical protein V1835_05310 [Candidatus Micrarchaeota archaeon]